MLFRALLAANDAQIAAVARQAVSRFAGMEAGRPVGGTYYLYRTLRNLDLDRVLERLMARPRRDPRSRRPTPAPPVTLTALDERLARDEFQSRLDALRPEIEDEIRRRLVADRGTEALARSLRKPLPEDIDFMHATRDELASLRRAIHPLTRKLAVRLARKRRHGRKGPLDFRSTMRHSPVDRRGAGRSQVPLSRARPSRRSSSSPTSRDRWPPSPASPCISSTPSAPSSRRCAASCSSTASTRSRGSSNGVDDPADAVHRINTEADVVWVDGHSDYGHALSVFWDRWGEEITPRTSVLLLGRRPEQLSRLPEPGSSRRSAHRARHVYWLNPEPRAYWGTGDSIVGEYAVHCDEVFECRNLRQLEHFVGDLA